MTVELVKPHQGRYVKALFFGPSTHGKTTLLGTANDDRRTGPTLLLDFEGGVQSLVGQDIAIAPIRSWADFNDVYARLLAGDLKEKFRSVCIDSITEVHKFALMTLLGAKDATVRPDEDSMVLRDYGRATVQIRRLLTKFRDLQMHVFYSALSEDVDQPMTVQKLRQPSMPGKMANEVVAMMDVVGYLDLHKDEAGKMHRVLMIGATPNLRCKVRAPQSIDIPDGILDPTVGKLIDLLTGKLKRDTMAESESQPNKPNQQEEPAA